MSIDAILLGVIADAVTDAAQGAELGTMTFVDHATQPIRRSVEDYVRAGVTDALRAGFGAGAVSRQGSTLHVSIRR